MVYIGYTSDLFEEYHIYYILVIGILIYIKKIIKSNKDQFFINKAFPHFCSWRVKSRLHSNSINTQVCRFMKHVDVSALLNDNLFIIQ